MPTLTAHCLVKNEENFIGPVLESVLDHVDKAIVFDTGSTDKTVEIIKRLADKFPEKIMFEEKGVCDKVRHTALRQEMVDRTATDWFMILDGDEVWTDRAMAEAIEAINDAADAGIECLVSPFYLCVGDIYHQTKRSGQINILGRQDYHYPRFLRNKQIKWQGDYNEDTLINAATGEVFFNEKNTKFLKEKYWHTTHLRRSSVDDNDYSSGNSRRAKRRETYAIIGRKINEQPPEVLSGVPRLSRLSASSNLILLICKRLCQKI